MLHLCQIKNSEGLKGLLSYFSPEILNHTHHLITEHGHSTLGFQIPPLPSCLEVGLALRILLEVVYWTLIHTLHEQVLTRDQPHSRRTLLLPAENQVQRSVAVISSQVCSQQRSEIAISLRLCHSLPAIFESDRAPRPNVES